MVRSPNSIAIAMGERAFDRIRVPFPAFVQQRGCCCSKTMGRHFIGRIAMSVRAAPFARRHPQHGGISNRPENAKPQKTPTMAWMPVDGGTQTRTNQGTKTLGFLRILYHFQGDF